MFFPLTRISSVRITPSPWRIATALLMAVLMVIAASTLSFAAESTVINFSTPNEGARSYTTDTSPTYYWNAGAAQSGRVMRSAMTGGVCPVPTASQVSPSGWSDTVPQTTHTGLGGAGTGQWAPSGSGIVADYCYALRLSDSSGNHKWSGSYGIYSNINYTTPNESTVVITSDTTPTFTWSGTAGTGRLLQASPSGGSCPTLSLANEGAWSNEGTTWTTWAGTVSSATAPTLTSGYCYGMRITQPNGTMAYSGRYLLDTAAPTVTTPTINMPGATFELNPRFSNSTDNTVVWSGNDSHSGIDYYTLEYDDGPIALTGSCSGALWGGTMGLTYTSASASFNNTTGYCYRYRVQATDYAGYSSAFSDWSYLLVDTTAPSTPVITDNTATLDTAHRDGNIIWINTDDAGNVILTSTATDNESGILAHSFETQASNDFEGGNPAQHTRSWTQGSPPIQMAITAYNQADGASTSASIALTPDSLAPSIFFSSPSSLTETDEATLSFAWAEADADSGINEQTAVLQTAPINGESCSTSWTDTDQTWADPTTSLNPTVEDDACYRLELETSDNVNNISTTTSSAYLFESQAPQTITFAPLADKIYGDAPFVLTATATSGLTVSFSAVGDCGVNGGGTVTLTGAGDCTITAMQAGNEEWETAPNVVRTFNIAKATPVITWADPADIMYGTVLSSTQLNATTTTAGTFTYTPPAGTLLEGGVYELSVSFVPTNTANYNNISGTADIEVLLAAPPPESGLRNWTFADEEPRFDNGVTVIDDPTAPSGDGKVALLSSASGQLTANSEHVTVVGGEQVTVWGDWRLVGHGTRLRLCFDVGGCTTSATVGNLTGSTVYSIDWITFELSSLAPAGATEAWLSWTVGSDGYSDGFSWNVLAADDTGITRVEVSATISVSAPATINFGAGLPGDALDHNDFIVTVTTNNATGYGLVVAGTNMASPGSDSIAITQMQIGPANSALTAFAAENTDVPLTSASERTDAAGDDHALDARLTLPFVGSGLYEGTLTFTASVQ